MKAGDKRATALVVGTASNSSSIADFARSAIVMRIATQIWTRTRSHTTAHIGGALIAASRKLMNLVRSKHDGIRIIKMNIHKDHTVSILSILLYVTNARDVLGNRRRSREPLQDQADEYWAFGKPTQKY